LARLRAIRESCLVDVRALFVSLIFTFFFVSVSPPIIVAWSLSNNCLICSYSCRVTSVFVHIRPRSSLFLPLCKNTVTAIIGLGQAAHVFFVPCITFDGGLAIYRHGRVRDHGARVGRAQRGLESKDHERQQSTDQRDDHAQRHLLAPRLHHLNP
jgi:hypothetical protein